ncbi:hypothetical protein XENTR_v10009038 [Xenopus tropicalis]|nr:hypothetical protein XENTR_v10009038 [Xenopus tropicalis]
MESLRSVIAAMMPGQFLASLDIKDAYLHVPIFPPHQRFLHFALQNFHYQFTAIPFGLTSAPAFLPKSWRRPQQCSGNTGISITPYLDDLLIKAPSLAEAQQSLQSSMATLQDLGWCINLTKSSLIPNQSMVFLRMQFDTQTQRVSLPYTKALHLQSLVRSLLSKPRHTVGFCMRVLGVMVSTIEAVPFAQYHLRELQWNILSAWKQKSLHQEIRLTHQARVSWWLRSDRLLTGKPLGENSWRLLTTDASLSGWGAVLENHPAQGQWSPEERTLLINILEIRAIRLGLFTWQHELKGQAVKVQTDNSTAVAYINHQGGTRSRMALNEVRRIFQWAENNQTHLSAIYIPGLQNWEADFLSRQVLDPGEWSLKDDIFHEITLKWGIPEVDLMATRQNRKVPNSPGTGILWRWRPTL